MHEKQHLGSHDASPDCKVQRTGKPSLVRGTWGQVVALQKVVGICGYGQEHACRGPKTVQRACFESLADEEMAWITKLDILYYRALAYWRLSSEQPRKLERGLESSDIAQPRWSLSAFPVMRAADTHPRQRKRDSTEEIMCDKCVCTLGTCT